MSLDKDIFNHVQLRLVEDQYGVRNINREYLPNVDRVRWVWWKSSGMAVDYRQDTGGTWHSVETDKDFDKAFPVLVAAVRLAA